ncbi:fasciclin domain-containing protein [Streptomyces sp. NPDC004838]
MKSIRVRRTAMAATAALSLPLSLGLLSPQALADTATPSPTTPSASEPFGPGCSSLPKSGTGSAMEMAKERVATAIDTNPHLSMLADAVKKADLTSTLDKLKNSTVFAPTNAAFNTMGKAKVDALLNDKAQLKKLLTYHVVEKDIKPADLPHGSFTTLEGSKLTTSGSGTSYKVNGTVPISCGNIHTSNAKLYIVDGVLAPPS